MDTILEIIKITLPAAIVYFTVHSLWKSYLSAQLQAERQKQILTTDADKARLAIQAYERLLIFCERINPYQMQMRLSVPEMGGRSLAGSMIMAINQEFEHNVSQQLYVSETLWKIVTTAKNQLIEIIAASSEAIPAEAGQADFMEALNSNFLKLAISPLDRAKAAIKQSYDQ